MKDLFTKLAKKPAQFAIAGLTALSLSFGAAANVPSTPGINDMPFPSKPATFLDSSYNNYQGCVANDRDEIFYISENSRSYLTGAQLKVELPGGGEYNERLYYNSEKDEGVLLVHTNGDIACVNETLSGFTFNGVAMPTNVSYSTVTEQQCNFVPARFGGVCDSLPSINTKLTSKGYKAQWQATKENGDLLTVYSGNGITFYVTTDVDTSASVLVARSTEGGEYIVYDQTQDKEDEVPSIAMQTHP